ncbi:MAG: type II toxin-antitoxin system Phd/YefM family antitoxin [Desulfosoma sp.]
MTSRVITATQARTRFGECIRRATMEGETIIVERDGKPAVVIVSFEEYQRLHPISEKFPLDDFEPIFKVNSRINARREGRPLTDPVEQLRFMREERDAHLNSMC